MQTAIYTNPSSKQKYRTLKELGKGQFGLVQLCQIQNPNFERDIKSYSTEELIKKKFVAMKKIVNVEPEKGIPNDALREITILREIRHENLIKLEDVFTSDKNTYVALEYMTCDLAKLIDDKTFTFTESDIKFVFHQILTGFSVLHSNYIIHRDIKPNNIMVSIDGTCKIIDFGIARYLADAGRPMTGGVCTRWYKPPEIAFGAKHYGFTVDVWSLGCILAELYMKEPIFRGEGAIDQLSRIFGIRGTPNETTWPGVTRLPDYMQFEPVQPVMLKQQIPNANESAIDLIEKMLVQNPSGRITIKQALSHEYFSGLPKKSEISYKDRLKKLDYIYKNNLANNI